MSSICFQFDLRVPQTDHEKWVILIQGLCNEEFGAYLEERVEPFWETAESALADLMDTWEKFRDFPLFDDYEQNENKISFTVVGGYGLPEEVAKLQRLFSLCGADVNVTDQSLVDRDDV